MLLGLPLFRPKEQYAPLSLVDLTLFLATTAYNLVRAAAPSVLLDAFLTTCLYVIYILPFELAIERYYRRQRNYPAKLSLLQDLAIRIVRLAFAYYDTSIGRLFFSEKNIIALHKRRMGGRGAFDRNIALYRDADVQGYWIAPGRAQKLARGEAIGHNGFTLMYIHGGGFTLASPAFYLEFLLRICEELSKSGIASPAIFAISYTLVPEGRFPTQLSETAKAWQYLCRHSSVDTTRLGLAGDSAGACLSLSLMLYLREDSDERVAYPTYADSSSDDATVVQGSVDRRARFPIYPPVLPENQRIPKPSHAILISPWASLTTSISQDPSIRAHTATDFIDPQRLAHFARLYSCAQKTPARAGVMRFLKAKTKFLFPSFPLLPPFLSPMQSRSSSVRRPHRNGHHKSGTRSRQRSGEKQLNGRPSQQSTPQLGNGSSSRSRIRAGKNGKLRGEDYDDLSVILRHVEHCRLNPLLSPGDCTDQSWWTRSAPTKGTLIQYGSSEVLSSNIDILADRLRADIYGGGEVILSSRPLPHAWPQLLHYLGATSAERASGIKEIAAFIQMHL
ncbi:uncharacterized protein L969DRAFT_92535 [Mixia osmundae IAM 14324]|uniref:Alpha/beta hydrolase fold-3 domain-containing protein n=1 Tax=Mixia osmundae (strain CBS 9802 / IAM 14324 / JCM 22182 / KY 12970) TaxID=764103 RepID=G7DXU3_MIXOS|nr:uncharacterized protein L969DRAFT_92535 [Mixia osmundae IAM 14324]KEI41306.1 hypothetical protein L969DRAFT_92535 [Mixia osmundae IAM 14324]GAA95403.1 hypothetical protein E5Q_02057 [Mixia osmundae IAM 14324]